ncbi:hypothetical protein OC00_15065, partial [Xanthomonas vasicola]
HLHQITLAAGQDEALYPTQICLLGAQAVVPYAQAVARLIQQLRPLRLHLPGSNSYACSTVG